MHPMIIFGGLLHVTLLAVVAFFVLFAAQKAQGLVKLLGNVLGLLLLVLAVLAVVGTLTAPMFGGRPFGMAPGAHMEFRVMHRDIVVDAQEPNADADPPAEEVAPAN